MAENARQAEAQRSCRLRGTYDTSFLLVIFHPNYRAARLPQIGIQEIANATIGHARLPSNSWMYESKTHPAHRTVWIARSFQVNSVQESEGVSAA